MFQGEPFHTEIEKSAKREEVGAKSKLKKGALKMGSGQTSIQTTLRPGKRQTQIFPAISSSKKKKKRK